MFFEDLVRKSWKITYRRSFETGSYFPWIACPGDSKFHPNSAGSKKARGKNNIYIYICGAVYAHKGRTKKLKRHGLHGLALDQPSIDGIGPIKRSEKKTFEPSKKTALRGNAYLFNKKMRVGQVLAWSCFRLFPTFSDRFIFFWTFNRTNSIYGRLIQCKPVQTMTLKFFRATLVRVPCTKYCILTLISNIP